MFLIYRTGRGNLFADFNFAADRHGNLILGNLNLWELKKLPDFELVVGAGCELATVRGFTLVSPMSPARYVETEKTGSALTSWGGNFDSGVPAIAPLSVRR